LLKRISGDQKNWYIIGEVRYNQQGRRKCQCIERSQIPGICTQMRHHEGCRSDQKSVIEAADCFLDCA